MFLILIAIGRHIEISQLPSALIGAFLLGALVGFLRLVNSYSSHAEYADYRQWGFSVTSKQPWPTVSLFIVPAIVFPLGVLLALAFAILFESRFIGLCVLAPITLVAFYRSGAAPVDLADHLIQLDGRWTVAGRAMDLTDHRPDMPFLAAVLLSVWLAPAISSNGLAMVIVLAICAVHVIRKITPLLHVAPLMTIVGAVAVRGSVTLRFYGLCAAHPLHWQPEDSEPVRTARALCLIALLDLTLLVGLGFFCPWEPFAAWTVPNFHSDFLFHPQYEMGDFAMACRTVRTGFAGATTGAVLATFVIAVLAYVFLPVVVLLSAYFAQLVALEQACANP